jgi:hypothetical protein
VCAACLRAHEEGRVELVASPLLIAEVRDVLARPKFRSAVSAARADRFVEALTRDCLSVPDKPHPDAVSRDPEDDYLVALAREASAHILVSGDAHLLELDLPDLRIVSPREFLELLPS